MRTTLALIVACAWGLAHAQNKVPLPPGPALQTDPPSNPWAPNTAFPAYVIRTDSGVIECPRRYVEPGCRPYVKGRDRRPRAFVRQVNGKWMKCPDATAMDQCVGLNALPNLRVQE
jgi:hypothetical protein